MSGEYVPIKFASKSSRFGQEYVDVSVVKDWDSRRSEGTELLKKCEELYQEVSLDPTLENQ